MAPITREPLEYSNMASDLDFERLVELHYLALYRFALSMTRNETEAWDLTQQAFYILAKNSSQLRNPERVKSWLFTTLHREYLKRRRKMIRFPESEVSKAEESLPSVAPTVTDADAPLVLQALAQVEPPAQAAVALFYLEEYSYLEIANILEVPLGTVKSRISRGLAQLQRIMADRPAGPRKGVP